MINYQRDDEKQYDEAIKNMLRGHNEKFSNIQDFSTLFIYVLEDDDLVGALKVNYFWNWISVGQTFYKNIAVLKQLVNQAWDYYKEKAEGMKFFSTVKTRVDDFVSAGFEVNGIIKLTETETLYYADFKSVDSDLKNEYKVITSEEPLEPYQAELESQTKAFNKKYQIEDPIGGFDLAALDGEQCIGGIQGDVYSDRIYLNRLAVDPNYRKQSIGSALIRHAIEFAREKNLEFIMLGTCEFQAKGFYEKSGFEVVYVRENNPKGYKSFTMMIRL